MRTDPVATNIVISTIMKKQALNGVSVNALRLRDEFTRQGIENSLITPFDAGVVWLPIFAVRKFGLEQANRNVGMRWFVYWSTRALKRALSRHLSTSNVGVVMAQCPLSALVALELRSELKQDYPVLMVKHFDGLMADEWLMRDMLTDEKTAIRFRKLELDVIKSVDAVVYVSEWLKESLEPRLKVLPQESHVIWNGIDEVPAVASGFDRKHLGLTGDNLVLVNVGVIDSIKNQLQLLDLFALIQSRKPHAHLLLVGEGPDSQLVAQKSSELGISDHVHMLGRRNDVREILRTADMYIHFSRTEALPLILLEAAQAGLPIAGVPVGGVTETMTALGGTVEITHEDHEGSYIALGHLLNDPQLRKAYGELNRTRFNEHFTIEAAANSYRTLADTLTRQRKGMQSGIDNRRNGSAVERG